MNTPLPYMSTYLLELQATTSKTCTQSRHCISHNSSNLPSIRPGLCAITSIEEPGRGKCAPEGGGIGSSEPRVRSIRHKEGKFGRWTAVAYVFRHNRERRYCPIGFSRRKKSICSWRSDSACRRCCLIKEMLSENGDQLGRPTPTDLFCNAKLANARSFR